MIFGSTSLAVFTAALEGFAAFRDLGFERFQPEIRYPSLPVPNIYKPPSMLWRTRTITGSETGFWEIPHLRVDHALLVQSPVIKGPCPEVGFAGDHCDLSNSARGQSMTNHRSARTARRSSLRCSRNSNEVG
jgi:hypothetical protein